MCVLLLYHTTPNIASSLMYRSDQLSEQLCQMLVVVIIIIGAEALRL